MIKVDIPQITVEQERGANVARNYLYQLPSSGAYGSLFNKSMDFATRHHYINTLIREVFIEHGIGKSIREQNEYYSLDANHYTYKCHIETIVYWMRKTADDVIALLFYLEYITTHEQEPGKLSIDNIGKLIHGNPKFKNSLSENMGFLHQLNEVSNGYKHSFVNTEVNHLIGAEEPTVVALFLKHNNSVAMPDYHSYSLRSFVDNYTAFYTISRKLMSDFRNS